MVESAQPTRQLEQCERWLRHHAHDGCLLLAAGRIALRAKLWGKARGYLESSLTHSPSVEGWRLLGALLEAMDDTGAALEAYRKMSTLADQRAQEKQLGIRLEQPLPLPELPAPEEAHRQLADAQPG